MKRICLALMLCVAVALAWGCSKSADEDKPIAEVKAEAEKMDTSQLRSQAEAYAEAIKEKAEEVKQLVEKQGEIPMTEKLSEEAKALANEIKQLNESIGKLKERLKVYVDKLEEKGGDTSGLDA